MRRSAGAIALGGVLAALALVIMMLGGLIPVATFISPVICAVLLNIVLLICGRKIAWAWYGCVSILGLLLAPDKESAAVFIALGYYPIIKRFIDTHSCSWLLKAVFFNLTSAALYFVLLWLIGMEHLVQEFQELGTIGLLITLVLGNICFFLLDIVLSRISKKKK